MNGAVDNRRLLAYVLHDVDFAAARPSHSVEVISEHPKRGPHALSIGDAAACFEASVSLRKLSLSLHARRGVVAAHAVTSFVFLSQGLYDEVAILKLRI